VPFGGGALPVSEQLTHARGCQMEGMGENEKNLRVDGTAYTFLLTQGEGWHCFSPS
jgi:hypothetical protein